MAVLPHRHYWIESVSGCWADEPGGPRTMHLIHWQCSRCGKIIGDTPDFTPYSPGETRAARHGLPAARAYL